MSARQTVKQVIAAPDELDREPYVARRLDFLQNVGWDRVEIEALPYDASYRRYYRIHGGPKPALLMDAVLDVTEPIENFIKVDNHLRRLGFSAPEIYETDLNEKLALVEDFGNDVYHRLIEQADNPRPCYESAIDVLIALHKHPDVLDIDLPMFTVENWLEQLSRYVDWFYPAQYGLKMDQGARAEFSALWREMYPLFKKAPDNFVHYDFIPENLMRVSGRSGLQACGILDFQIACIGPCSWDLAGLLEDARRPVPEEIRTTMKRRYLAGRPDLDQEAFETSYAVFAAQRNIRILGNFARLCVRDGKPKYLAFVPHVQGLVAGYLENPVLKPVKDWFSAHKVDITKPLPEKIEKHSGFPL